MSTFQKVKLDDIANEHRDAYFPSTTEAIPYIGLEHIEQQTLRLSGIGKSSDAMSQKKKFIAGDVLYGSLRPYFRKVYKPNFDGVCSTDITVLKPQNHCSNSYLFYLIASPEFISKASGAGTGTKMPRAGWKVVKDFIFDLPDLPTQTRIASVLSAYDNLIENNEKRVKALEEMAQLLYTEWFVKFKFPGLEKVKMFDSGTEYGMLPEGWEVKKIGEKFDVILGGTPSRSKKEYWENGTVPWINSGKVNALRIIDESEWITEEALKKSATKIMPRKTTLLAITGATLGQVSFTEIECCANQSVVGIYDKTGLFSEYIYLTIDEIIKTIIALAGGGAQQHINKDIVNNTEIVIPGIKLMNIFSKKVKPMFDEIASLMFQNKTLSQTRDLLIPQLVTGRREVKYQASS